MRENYAIDCVQHLKPLNTHIIVSASLTAVAFQRNFVPVAYDHR